MEAVSKLIPNQPPAGQCRDGTGQRAQGSVQKKPLESAGKGKDLPSTESGTERRQKDGLSSWVLPRSLAGARVHSHWLMRALLGLPWVWAVLSLAGSSTWCWRNVCVEDTRPAYESGTLQVPPVTSTVAHRARDHSLK